MVVLPAPLGPSSAKTVPSATSRSMPSSTTCSPNDLRARPPIADRDGMMAMLASSRSGGPGGHDRPEHARHRVQRGFTAFHRSRWPQSAR